MTSCNTISIVNQTLRNELENKENIEDKCNNINKNLFIKKNENNQIVNKDNSEYFQKSNSIRLPIINNRKNSLKYNKYNTIDEANNQYYNYSKSLKGSKRDEGRRHIRDSYKNIFLEEIKNINVTKNNLISVSHKNFDLRKILENEKSEEIKKFNFIENLMKEHHNNKSYERIFEMNPLEGYGNDLIKNRNKFIIRNKKLTLEKEIKDFKNSQKYSLTKTKPLRIFDFNTKLKLKLLEKDVEMQLKYKQNKNLKNNKFDSNEFITEKQNAAPFSTINNHSDIHNQINNPISNSSFNFIKETINNLLDESGSIDRIPNKNDGLEIKAKDAQIPRASNLKKSLNGLDLPPGDYKKFEKEKNSNILRIDKSTKKGNQQKLLFDNSITSYNNNEYLISDNEKDEYERNINYNTYKNFHKNQQAEIPERKKAKHTNIYCDDSKNENKKNNKENSFSYILNTNDANLDPNPNLLDFDCKSPIKTETKTINKYENIYTDKNTINNTANELLNLNKLNNSSSNCNDDNEKNSVCDSDHMFDEEKLQKLDDSGVLLPVKYESVYYKAIKNQNKDDIGIIANDSDGKNSKAKVSKKKEKMDDISLVDIEPKHKTNLEIEKIKDGIKGILRRRFDFSDNYLNNIHKKLQKTIIKVDPQYKKLKNKYYQYNQQKILAKKDHETAMELHMLNKNPILQVNNMVSFPMIVNDPMLLANIYNINMFNLEFTNNDINNFNILNENKLMQYEDLKKIIKDTK